MNLCLDAIRGCFEGAIPATIATCAPDGTPNVAYLSQVHFVDNEHIALSFQFFNTTRQNILANPHATVQVIDPDTAAHYYLSVQYLRTETAGPLFEYMKARLAGVASQTGMSKVFVLRGSDVYRVLGIQPAVASELPGKPTQRNRLPALRACAHRLTACRDLETLLDGLLDGLHRQFDIRHAMVLMYDAAGQGLYTVASLGYAESGVGSEIALGAGVIGVAAQAGTPIRIGYMTGDYSYSRALRERLGEEADCGKEIPFPGLAEPHSQMAVPITAWGRLFGVLYVESMEDLRFDYEDEDALATLAHQLGLAMCLFEQHAENHEETTPAGARSDAGGALLTVRHYRTDHSIFIDGEYLIKGVAGAILWKLLSHFEQLGRSEFTNRELRLDPALRLPDISDNLEARLILLQRRLAERCPALGIEKTGRGRFRLRLDRPVELTES